MTKELTQSRRLPEAGAEKSTLPLPWVERIFERLSAYYGSKFADAWRGTNPEIVKRVWAEDLGGFTKDELSAGIEGCKGRDWPPTLPEFLKLCRPPIDYEKAFFEATEQLNKRGSNSDRWSHPAIYWAATKIGSSDMNSHSYQTIKGRWAQTLDTAIEDVKTGQLPNEIPVRRTALPAPGSILLPKEEASKRLNYLIQKMKSGQIQTKQPA